MRKSKIISLFITLILALTSAVSFSACSSSIDLEKTREFASMMTSAVEKIEEVNEMFIASEEDEGASPMLAKSTTGNSLFSTALDLPTDMNFRQLRPTETIVRQVQVKYPYVIVDYLLQTSAEGNVHKKKFDVDKTIYGPARKTINDTLNELFEDPSVPDPVLAIQVSKTEDGFTFSADWDWRNDYVLEYAPNFNTVITCDGQVEFYSNGKTVKRILMNWSWEYVSNDIMSCIMDFENNEFYFLESFRASKSLDKTPSYAFNDGELSFDKMLEYGYEGAHVIKSNISEDPQNIDFKAYGYYDGDNTSVSSQTRPAGDEYYGFIDLYHEVYAKLVQDGLKFRGKDNPVDVSGGVEIDYMDSATSYAFNRSSVVTTPTSVAFAYINEKDLTSILKHLSHDDKIKNNQTLLDVVNGAEKSLENLNGPYVGELGKYNGKKYTLGFLFEGGYTNSSFDHHCNAFSYELSDGETSIIFSLKNKKPENIRILNLDHFKIEHNEEYGINVISIADKSVEEIVIPSSYKGMVVNRITGFNDCPNLKSVTIMNGPTEISDSAFKNCPNLKEVVLPDSIQYIFDSAFMDCTSLEEIIIPGKVSEYNEPNNIFKNCVSLKEVTFLEGYKRIYGNMFNGCVSLEKINFPTTLTSIGSEAFNGCNNIKELTIPKNLTDYSSYNSAFSNLSGLEKVVFEVGTTKILPKAFSGCTNLKEVIIPDTVTEIGNSAFSNCVSLTSFTIPNGVTEIGNSAFSNCVGLTSFTIPNGVTSLDDAFAGCTGLTEIIIPEGVTSLFGTFAGCTGLTQISIPEGVTSISRTFDGCTNLSKISLPNSLTDLGGRTFQNCTSLTEVTIPYGDTQIDRSTFFGCSNLKKVVIPNSVTRIFISAFENCMSLEEIIIPDSVQAISESAFMGCTSLEKIIIPDSVRAISASAFMGCASLEEIIVPDSVTTIGNNSFNGCVGLKSVTLGLSLGSIGYNAFSGCVNLKTVINNSLLPITAGDNNYGGVALYAEQVLLPDYTEVEENGFVIQILGEKSILKSYTGNDTILTIPEGVTHILDSTIIDNKRAYTVILPSSLKILSTRAFKGCPYIVEVVNKSSSITIIQNDFPSCLEIYNSQDEFITTKVKIEGDFVIYDDTTLIYSNPVEKLIIPDKITSIYYGMGALNDCENVTTYLECKAELVMVSGFTKLQKVVITGGERILNSAFENCTSLTEVVLPNSIKSIGAGAFYNCSSLKEITLPNGITDISYQLFRFCSSLKSIVIPDSVIRINAGAFAGCSSLEKINLNKVQILSSDVFKNCTNLREIIIPTPLIELAGSLGRAPEVLAINTIDRYYLEDLFPWKNWGLHYPEIVIFLGEVRSENNYLYVNHIILSTDITNSFLPQLNVQGKNVLISDNPLEFTNVNYWAANNSYLLFDGTEEEWNTYFNSLTETTKQYVIDSNKTIAYRSDIEPSDTTKSYWYMADGELKIWE